MAVCRACLPAGQARHCTRWQLHSRMACMAARSCFYCAHLPVMTTAREYGSAMPAASTAGQGQVASQGSEWAGPGAGCLASQCSCSFRVSSMDGYQGCWANRVHAGTNGVAHTPQSAGLLSLTGVCPVVVRLHVVDKVVDVERQDKSQHQGILDVHAAAPPGPQATGRGLPAQHAAQAGAQPAPRMRNCRGRWERWKQKDGSRQGVSSSCALAKRRAGRAQHNDVCGRGRPPSSGCWVLGVCKPCFLPAECTGVAARCRCAQARLTAATRDVLQQEGGQCCRQHWQPQHGDGERVVWVECEGLVLGCRPGTGAVMQLDGPAGSMGAPWCMPG